MLVQSLPPFRQTCAIEITPFLPEPYIPPTRLEPISKRDKREDKTMHGHGQEKERQDKKNRERQEQKEGPNKTRQEDVRLHGQVTRELRAE
jgi:hypothetical protein